MLVSRRISLVLCAAVLAALIVCATSLAAPVTVNLRVEGASSTIFEGAVTTDARTIEAPNYGTTEPLNPHHCDVNDNGAEPLGAFGTSYGNPTTTLYDAASLLGLAFHAYWYAPLNDFFVDGIGQLGPEGTEAWEYAVNYTTANVGGCQFQLAPGSNVLWAANYGFAKHLLSLSGPASVNVGAPFTVHVVDGQTGEPISGAVIGEVVAGVTTPIPASPTTDSNGNATVRLTGARAVTLKATQAESVRSNGLVVCPHNGNDGLCGTTITTVMGTSTNTSDNQTVSDVVDIARIVGIKNGYVYARRFAPRLLAGVVEIPTGGTLRQVRISLERSYRGHCFDFSGLGERFVRIKCGKAAQFFSVGDAESFSYLLPARLPAGRYVYDIEGIDRTGHTTKLVNGVSHFVFRVK
jgi:hypothetical protein